MLQRPRLKNAEILRIAAEAHRDSRTVAAVLKGDGGANSREAVVEAARKLGIKLPDEVEQ
jgi:hypothetical protein